MLKIFFKINFTVTIVWNTRETGDIYHDKFSTLCHRTMNTWYNPFSILNVWILPLGALGMDICEGSILWVFYSFSLSHPLRGLEPKVWHFGHFCWQNNPVTMLSLFTFTAIKHRTTLLKFLLIAQKHTGNQG